MQRLADRVAVVTGAGTNTALRRPGLAGHLTLGV